MKKRKKRYKRYKRRYNKRYKKIRSMRPEVKYYDTVIPISQINGVVASSTYAPTDLQQRQNIVGNAWRNLGAGTSYFGVIGSRIFVKSVKFMMEYYLCPNSTNSSMVTQNLASLNTAMIRFLIYNGNTQDGQIVPNLFAGLQGDTFTNAPPNRKKYNFWLDKTYTITSPITISTPAADSWKAGDGQITKRTFNFKLNRTIDFTGSPTSGSTVPKNEKDNLALGITATMPLFNRTTTSPILPAGGIAWFPAICCGGRIRIYYTDN
nr:capsid protein [Cressdnaviricota sp.]